TVSGLQTEMKAMGTEMSTMGTTVSGLQTEMKAMGTEMSTMGTTVSGLQTEMKAMGTEMSTMGTTVSGLQTEMNAMGAETRALNCRMGEVEEHVRDVATATGVSDALVDVAAKLVRRIEFGENIIIRHVLESEARLDGRIDELRSEVRQYHSSVVGHGNLISDLDERVTRLERPAS
ncbi:MAG: hypothetical protein FWD68_09305, partial [Alphaproteobacteria bacterium]|nr:hypothetical protein [Alphaproteobacteria bacterium]